MAEQWLDAYRRGKIGRVTLIRKLIQCGLSASAALSLVLAVAPPADAALPPPAARALNTAADNLSNAAKNNANMPPGTANLLNNAANAMRNNDLGNINNNNNNPPGGSNTGQMPIE